MCTKLLTQILHKSSRRFQVCSPHGAGPSGLRVQPPTRCLMGREAEVKDTGWLVTMETWAWMLGERRQRLTQLILGEFFVT